MQDARCQMQGARHTPCFCSSQLTAHGLEQQYNNPAKSLKTQYFTRHDQLNLAGDDHLPGLCNCHPKLPTVIYNCHLQLSSTTVIYNCHPLGSYHRFHPGSFHPGSQSLCMIHCIFSLTCEATKALGFVCLFCWCIPQIVGQ